MNLITKPYLVLLFKITFLFDSFSIFTFSNLEYPFSSLDCPQYPYLMRMKVDMDESPIMECKTSPLGKYRLIKNIQ